MEGGGLISYWRGKGNKKEGGRERGSSSDHAARGDAGVCRRFQWQKKLQ